MTYTVSALVAIVAAVALDLALGTRLLRTRSWWFAYAIVVFFQLLTNGWLTGRGIVRYADGAIIGTGHIVPLGEGRIAYAPLEDLGFGFALVLMTCSMWVWAGRGPRGTFGRETFTRGPAGRGARRR